MRAYELDALTKDFNIETGHRMCHQETCSCWNFRVYNLDGENVLNSDSSKEVLWFCGIGKKIPLNK